MMKYDFLIVGAGIFGATFAERAHKAGKTCLVIDKREHIAGNVYTEVVENIPVHKYGAHIFHTSDKKIWDYVNSFVSFRPFINSPLAEYRGKRYNLPFNMNTFNQLWGVTTEEAAREKIAEQTAPYSDIQPQNLEEQALRLVGPDIYEALIKGYTEKQWGRKCNELPAFIIKRLPLRFIYDNNYFNDIYQGIPNDGYTVVVEKMLQGIPVLLGTDYYDFTKATKDSFNKIVFTGKIDEFFSYELGKLEYRSLRFETETLPVKDFQGNAVINYTEYEVPYTRIIEHKHFSSHESASTVISREYPAEWTQGMEAYYPVNDDKNEKLAKAYFELAKTRPDIIFGGRLGEYKYYDMDKVISRALEVAEKELN